MEVLKEFLSSSTIHGIAHIPSAKRYVRLFWIFVVLVGFTGSILLIQQSFRHWEQSPITTTIETLPISEMTWPNVTVCPPKNAFLNLNYDIQQSEKVHVDNDTRKELLEYAIETIQERFYEDILANLSKVEDPDRFYNWYHGYTKMIYPTYQINQLSYTIETTATSGNISTQYFGDNFNADKVDGSIYVRIGIDFPKSAIRGNTTAQVDIEKEIMTEFNKFDVMRVYYLETIDADLSYWSKNFTRSFKIYLDRQLSKADFQNLGLDLMPGFRMRWKFFHEVENQSKYEEDRNKVFSR